MNKVNPGNKDFKFFIEHWNISYLLNSDHISWSLSQCKIITTQRNQILSETADKKHYFYFVCRGLLAHISYVPFGKRKIINLAYSGMALSSTIHLYSDAQIPGELIALRSGAIIAIPYTSLLACHPEDPAICALISRLVHQQVRFLHKMRYICWSLYPSERYKLFIKLLPDIDRCTTQVEQANLLGISRSCIQQQKRKLLFQK